jgi:hypothetical protein
MTSTALTMRVLDADEAHHLGSLLADSGYFDDARDAAKAAVKVMAGAELGIGAVAAMRGVDIIKGEVSLSAGLVAALVRGSERYDYEIERWDDGGCTLVFTRDGKPLNPPVTFDHSDAVKAQLAGGTNYQRYPRNMYFARAMTNGARLHCPDLFAGSVYTSAELQGTAVEADAPHDAVPPGSEPLPPASAPAPSLDEAITAGDVVVETPSESANGEGDRSIAQAAVDAPAPAEATATQTPADLARSYGIADATQRFILIGVAGVEDATDLDAAYRSLSDEQRDLVIAELSKRAAR